MPTGSENSGPAHPFLDFSGKEAAVVRDKEIFLVRRASDYGVSTGGEVGWMGGMGVDTKRYIEGLLNLR